MNRRYYIVFQKQNNYAILPLGEAELPQEAGHLLNEFLETDSYMMQGPVLSVEEVEHHIGSIMSFVLGKENATISIERLRVQGGGTEWVAVLENVDIAEGAVQ